MASELETPTCFLCVEPLHKSNKVQRVCCHNELCQDCLYRHIMSILVDDVGQFRGLCCPFGCSTHLSDKEVRECFRRQHCGFWVVDWLRWMAYAILSSLVSKSFGATTWWYIRLSSNERRDLERYMAWSLQRGLADLKKKQDDMIVLHCPGPDCSFQWIVGDPRHRRAKQRHEIKQYILWYAPYRGPDATPSRFLYGPNAGDVRRIDCPACRTTFCGLCRNPWRFGHANHSYRACRDYIRLLPLGENDALADRFALATSRSCPGCSRLISRIAGCNHISCPCGMHWCYACGSRWNSTHYYCTDPGSERLGAPNCVIL